MKKVKALIDFSRYTDADLSSKAGYILQQMTANSGTFVAPTPTLETLSAAIEDYNASLVEAEGLDRVKVSNKNLLRYQLEQLLGQEGTYVNLIAGGSENTVTLSGFSASKPKEPRVITFVGNVTIENGTNSGELKSSVKAPKGANSYLHEIAPDPLTDDTVWQSTASSRSRNTFEELTPGQKYWIRVAAIGSNGQVVYSNPGCKFAQ